MATFTNVRLRDDHYARVKRIKEITGISQEEIVNRALALFEKHVLPQYVKINKEHFDHAELN